MSSGGRALLERLDGHRFKEVVNLVGPRMKLFPNTLAHSLLPTSVFRQA